MSKAKRRKLTVGGSLRLARRAKAFEFEQGECVERLRMMIHAVYSGDMFEVNNVLALVNVSVGHLNDNDPQREGSRG